MFKRLETSWNAHTPKFLHNRTKENLIAQLICTVLLIAGFVAKDKWDARQERRRYNTNDNEN